MNREQLQPTNAVTRSSGDDEISLRDIFEALKRQRRLIGTCVGVAVLIGLLYAVLTRPLYTASVAVQPVLEDSGGLSGLASRFGGVASLAGISLGGGDSSREEYLAVLKSRELAERFIEENDIRRHLFPDEWDEERGKWRGENGGDAGGGVLAAVRGLLSRGLAALSGDEGGDIGQDGPGPSMWETYKDFDQKVRTIRDDTQTGIVTVSFEFRNPRLAAEWANAYVEMANREIRDKAIEEAGRALEYLNREVERTQVAGLRDTIYSLVETQLERIMLANARSEYAFKVIDRAVVPEERSHPRRGLIVILSLVLGAMVGVFAALVREAWRGPIAPGEEGEAAS